VLSHAAGVGQPISDELVRLIMVLKVNSLSRGFSGIRRVVIDALIALINAEVYPHIPLKGSVGASGDLAPLAHMSLVLLGEGKARYKGQWLNAVKRWKVAGLTPLTLSGQRRSGAAQRDSGIDRVRPAWPVRRPKTCSPAL
jgi:histidine ammonia-lyase